MCVMSVDINYLKNLICILHRARFDRPHTHSFTVTEEKLRETNDESTKQT